MQPGDPRADPVVVDLIELAGLWVAAEDWAALKRTLERLDHEFLTRFPDENSVSVRFRELRRLLDEAVSADEIRRTYRRASVG